MSDQRDARPFQRRLSSQYLSHNAPLSRVTSHRSITAGSLMDDGTSSLSTRGQRLPSLIQSHIVGANSHYWDDAADGDIERGIQWQRRTEREARDPRDPHNKQINVSGDGRGIDLDFEDLPEPPMPPQDYPLARVTSLHDDFERRASVLMAPQMRSQRLIGNSNPRYKWAQYFKTDDELKKMSKKLRKYYERSNFLIQQYDYIDKLLDSSVPHNLIQEYGTDQAQNQVSVPPTILEHADEHSAASGSPHHSFDANGIEPQVSVDGPAKVKRTKDLYKLPDEQTPLLATGDKTGKPNETAADDDDGDEQPTLPAFQIDEEEDSGAPIVTVAIYVNMVANTLLLILKIIVTVLTSSLSVLASLVDAALDFLSTAIVWTTTRLISAGEHDKQNFPVGRQRLEPIGVLVFSVIMITSFVQVGLESLNRLTGPDRTVVVLSVPAIAIMASTVLVKAACWFWCRLIRNSSVQALAQDAVTDVVFNIFSIIFPLVGYYARVWWLDPLGGLLLSLYVIVSWSLTSRTHILNLTGHAATADQRNLLLYLTMRFAHTIRRIQNLAAYHAGDKLIVEVDIVLDEGMSLRDSHDLGESLQYVLESVPGVERAFVHADYWEGNLPSHMTA